MTKAATEMRKNTRFKFWISIVSLICLSGCYYDKEELLYPGSNVNCTSVNARFTDVNAIIAVKCATAGCHNAAVAVGGTVLETYNDIKAKADRINQRAIIERTMPAGSPLSGSEIAILKCWISSGMPNN